MTTATKSKHKKNTNRPELIIALVLLGGFVLLLVLGVFLRNQPVELVNDGDIVRGAIIRATHEMGGGEPIPFLPKEGPQPNVEGTETFYDFRRMGA